MQATKEYSKYAVYNNSSRKEYVIISVMGDEHDYKTNYWFEVGGMGIEGDATAESLGDLIDVFEECSNVSGGRRTDDQIDEGTHMTKTHYDKAHKAIQNEIEAHGEDTTPAEWLEDVKK